MTDLHCHILPRMDDGPKNTEAALELIRAQIADGIVRAAATPHFMPERDPLKPFVERRAQAFEAVRKALDGAGLSFGMVEGAEVVLHPSLPDLDLPPLCIGSSGMMLVELPNEERWPLWADEVLHRLQLAGVVPILAHIARYPFLMRDLEKLAGLSESGVRLQVNADSLKQPLQRRVLLRLFRRRAVSFVASDCHSVQWRPPRLKEAFRVLGRRLPASECRRLLQNADDVFQGNVPPTPDVRPRRRSLLHWFG